MPAAEVPTRDIDLGVTFAIPSIMDLSWKPDNIDSVPYYLTECERDDIAERAQEKPPRKTLPRLEENQQAQISTDESNSGQSCPIPSITGIGPDPCDDTYDPPGEPGERFYTVLITKLDHDEAKELRRLIRNQGLGAFCDLQWSLKKFKAKPRAYRKGDLGDSYVCRGNREGVDSALMRERTRTRPENRRNVMIVEQDGGELSIEELIPLGYQTRTLAVLKIFEMFEV